MTVRWAGLNDSRGLHTYECHIGGGRLGSPGTSAKVPAHVKSLA